MPRASSGPQPNLRRGAKATANLRRGGPGRPRLSHAQKAEKKEVRDLCRNMLDAQYRRNLKKRLRDGKCQPGVEVALWYYAYGKPPETIETKTPTPIRLQHEFS